MEHSSIPDRPDQPPKQEVRQTVIVGLGVISTAQLIFLLVSLPFIWFGGATAWQLILFVVIGGGALVGIRWLRVAISRQRVRERTAFLALAVPLVDVVLVALLSAGFLGGSCTDEELRLSKEIPTFEAVAMSFDYEPESGACAGFFEVVASAEDVLTHYQRELEDDGWSVRREEIPSGDGPEGEQVVTAELSASRGSASFTIALESFSGRTNAAVRIDA